MYEKRKEKKRKERKGKERKRKRKEKEKKKREKKRNYAIYKITNAPTAQSDDRLVRETRVTVILIFYLCTICISALHVYVSSTPEIL